MSRAEHAAWVALGGNEGDVLAAFGVALGGLSAAGATVVAVSSAYRTVALVPAGAPPGPDYWNAVCRVRTGLSPAQLLQLCQRLEAQAGRRRGLPWGPRTLDLDLLLYDDCQSADPALHLPHPQMARRAFVLAPLVELDPSCVIPGEGPAARLLARLPETERGILAVRSGWWLGG